METENWCCLHIYKLESTLVAGPIYMYSYMQLMFSLVMYLLATLHIYYNNEINYAVMI